MVWSSPAPPCSSGTVTPSTPSSASARRASIGTWCSLSHAAVCGATSRRQNSRTSACTSRWASLNSGITRPILAPWAAWRNPEPALRLDVPRAEALAHATELIARAWDSFDHARPEQPPVDEQLRAALAAPIALGPTPVLQALDEAAVVLDHSIAQPRPRYFAFVASSGLEIAVLGDALAACHDVNLAVVSGAADLVERQTLEWLGQAFGYPVATGTFSSGGTVSNVTALAAARERALPGSRHTGLSGPPVRALRVRRRARVGQARGRAARHRARPRARHPDRRRGGACASTPAPRRSTPTAPRASAPIAVVATAGTTLTGAVDPLDALADVCEPRGVWLHVDGAYGLPAALVESHAPLFHGLARADSVTVDAHKWLFVPKACGVLMVREAEWLERAFTHDATYVPARAGRAGRRRPHARVLAPVPRAQAVAGAARARAGRLPQRDRAQPRPRRACSPTSSSERDELELLGEPELSVVPFRHIATSGPLDEHNRALAAALRADGRVYVSGADIDGTACLRPCFVNFRTEPRGRAGAARRRARAGRGARLIVCAQRASLVGCPHDDADARCRSAARAARGRVAPEGRAVRLLLGDARTAPERRGAGRAG